MNWLLYIGGGILWTLLWIAKLNSYMPKDTGDAIKAILYLAPLAIWIWICWKFI